MITMGSLVIFRRRDIYHVVFVVDFTLYESRTKRKVFDINEFRTDARWIQCVFRTLNKTEYSEEIKVKNFPDFLFQFTTRFFFYVHRGSVSEERAEE